MLLWKVRRCKIAHFLAELFCYFCVQNDVQVYFWADTPEYRNKAWTLKSPGWTFTMFYAYSDTQLKNVGCVSMLQSVPCLTIQFTCSWFLKLPDCTDPGVFSFSLYLNSLLEMTLLQCFFLKDWLNNRGKTQVSGRGFNTKCENAGAAH